MRILILILTICAPSMVACRNDKGSENNPVTEYDAGNDPSNSSREESTVDHHSGNYHGVATDSMTTGNHKDTAHKSY